MVVTAVAAWAAVAAWQWRRQHGNGGSSATVAAEAWRQWRKRGGVVAYWSNKECMPLLVYAGGGGGGQFLLTRMHLKGEHTDIMVIVGNVI